MPGEAGKPGGLKEGQVTPTGGEDNPNGKGVTGQRWGLEEAMGSEVYMAQANLIRLHMGVSVWRRKPERQRPEVLLVGHVVKSDRSVGAK